MHIQKLGVFFVFCDIIFHFYSYGDLVYKLKIIVGKPNVSDQFKKITLL